MDRNSIRRIVLQAVVLRTISTRIGRLYLGAPESSKPGHFLSRDRFLAESYTETVYASSRVIPSWIAAPAGLQLVQRAEDGPGTPVEDVRVDLGGDHASVAEQFLNGPDVVAVLQKMRRE